MNSFISTYLNWGYLTGISKSVWFQEYLLYFAIFILILPVVLKIIFKFTKRSGAYKKFDKLWFWSFISLGVAGIIVWFFVNQSLPTLGSRLVVFIWLATVVILCAYSTWYYRYRVTAQVLKYHEKKRKEKYLRR